MDPYTKQLIENFSLDLIDKLGENISEDLMHIDQPGEDEKENGKAKIQIGYRPSVYTLYDT